MLCQALLRRALEQVLHSIMTEWLRRCKGSSLHLHEILVNLQLHRPPICTSNRPAHNASQPQRQPSKLHMGGQKRALAAQCTQVQDQPQRLILSVMLTAELASVRKGSHSDSRRGVYCTVGGYVCARVCGEKEEAGLIYNSSLSVCIRALVPRLMSRPRIDSSNTFVSHIGTRSPSRLPEGFLLGFLFPCPTGHQRARV